MDAITLVYILVAIIFGASSTYFVASKKIKKIESTKALEEPMKSSREQDLVEELNQKIQAREKQVSDLEIKLKNALDNNTDEFFESVKAENKILKKRIENSDKLLKIERDNSSSNISELQTKISINDEEIKRLKQSIVASEKEIASKDIELSAKISESENLQYDIKKFQDKYKELENSKNELKADFQNQISRYEEQLEENRQSIDSYKGEIAIVERYLKNKTAENKKLDSDIKTLQSYNQELKEEETKIKIELKNKSTQYKEELKSLNDDIEDLEDDLARSKKRLNEADEENNQLQDKIRKHIKDNRMLEEKKGNLETELQKKKDEYELLANSLSFVQEILTAENLKEEEIPDYGPIDKIVEYIEEDLNGIIPFDEQELKRWELTQKKSWIKEKTTIAFVGEFSAGKTSIVNRIIFNNNPTAPLLPVDMKAATAIPTYISGGVSKKFNFVSPDHVLKNISEETFIKVNKEVLSQVKGVTNLISHFVMTHDNETLSKMSILDTPGFSSNDIEDAERTLDVINECDALFWVVDVNAGGINKKSIDIIKSRLNKPLYIVINKVDTKAPSQVKETEEHMRSAFNDAGVPIKEFIHFSKDANIENIMKTIMAVQNTNGDDTFLKKIELDLKKRKDEWVLKENKTKSSVDNKMSEVNRITSSFNEVINSLSKNCSDAASIPQKKNWSITKKYEMSKSDWERLIYLLKDLNKKQLDQIKNLYKSQSNKLSEYEVLNNKYNTIFKETIEVRDYFESFIKLTNPLNLKKQ